MSSGSGTIPRAVGFPPVAVAPRIPRMHASRFIWRQRWFDLTSGLLFRPSIIIVALGVLGVVVPPIEAQLLPRASAWLGTEPASAQVLLGTVAGSMMTVISVVYSILLVALSLASMQFSTRVLGGMMRSRVSQHILGLFAGTFVYCLMLLRSIHVEPAPEVPGIALSLALALALTSLGGLVYFIHHIVQAIQAYHLVDRIATDTEAVIDAVFTEPGVPTDLPAPAPVAPDAVIVCATTSGYIQALDVESLRRLVPPGGRLVVVYAMGAFVSRGLPLAYAEGGAIDPDAVRAAFDVGPVRTLQDDVEFGLRQIVDIALKAISPAVNDPSTAATCIDHLGRLLIQLVGRRALPRERDGLVLPQPTHPDLIDLAFEQIRQYSRSDMAVALRQMRVLGDLASVTRHRASLDRLAAHGRLIESAARAAFPAEDCDELERRAVRLRGFTGTTDRGSIPFA